VAALSPAAPAAAADAAEPVAAVGGQISGGGHGDDGEARRQGRCGVGKGQAGPDLGHAQAGGDDQAQVRPRGQQQRGRGGRGQQAEQQQRPDRLGGLGGGRADQRQEADAQEADRDPAGRGDRFVDAGEQQRPGDRRHRHDDPAADGRGDHRVPGREAEDGAEENAGPGGAVAAAAGGGEEGEEEHPEAEDPGEDVADDHVVGPATAAEQADAGRHADRGGEQAEAKVDPGHQGRQRAGERDVAERVAGEHLGPQDQEVPGHAAGRRDQRPGQERVLQERVGEDAHAGAPARRAGRRRARRSRTGAACAARYTANAKLVTQNPIGYGE
jgi:hypothetical protein